MASKEAIEKEWDRCHPTTSTNNNNNNNNGASIPSCLYTDENPATTIKGCGFKDKHTAERTIRLTSQRGVRYKQYWTIKAMYERAKYHPHPTSGIQDAMQIFQDWLDTYQPPTSNEERLQQQQEWQEYHQLCNSIANSHSYGKVPTKEEIKRARQDVQIGKQCLVHCIQLAQRKTATVATKINCNVTLSPSSYPKAKFPLVAFIALFGGPGLHGYGKHTIISSKTTTDDSATPQQSSSSHVVIVGIDGLKEVLNLKSIPPLLVLLDDLQSMKIHHDWKSEVAFVVDIQYKKERTTLTKLWNSNNSPTNVNSIIQKRVQSKIKKCSSDNDEKEKEKQKKEVVDTRCCSWTCAVCTFEHIGESKQLYLACEVCGTYRPNSNSTMTNTPSSSWKPTPLKTKQQQLSLPTKSTTTGETRQATLDSVSSPTKRTMPSSTKKIASIFFTQQQKKQITSSRPSPAATPIPSSLSSSPTTTALSSSSSATSAPVTSSSLSSSSLSSWGSLRAPSELDVRGSIRKRRKAFDLPPPLMDYLVVMDFEWTADNKSKIKPIAEITQFPSVVLKLQDGTTTAAAATKALLLGRKRSKGQNNNNNNINDNDCTTTKHATRQQHSEKKEEDQELPTPYHPPEHLGSLLDDILLTTPLSSSSSSVSTSPTTTKFSPRLNFTPKQDAYVVSIFDSYVKPTLNPTLTQFSIDLTGITQDQVNNAPTIDQVLKSYMEWLQSINLIDLEGNRIGNWCFVTWGDCDIGSTLREELQYKKLDIPPCFHRWINLKDDSMFYKHYQIEPKGGLQHCVEGIAGLKWEGRAHNGLVDSINTAKIVRHMVQHGFRFIRSTRGLDKNGMPFGSTRGSRQSSSVTTTTHQRNDCAT